MSGIFSNGMYGYGLYGFAQYGKGEIALDTESIILSDIISGIRVGVRSVTENLDLTSVPDTVIARAMLQERNRIFINGNILNGGIPVISCINDTIPILKNVTSGTPQFRRSLPYGY